ncbi:MAG: CHAT domain-containing protein [Paracoccaceae bacterium]
MRLFIAFWLALFPFSALADLDRAIEAFNAYDLEEARNEASKALGQDLSDDNRLLARELFLLSEYYTGRDDNDLLDELQTLDGDLVATHGQFALERLEVLAAISDFQFQRGQLAFATRTYVTVIRIAQKHPDAGEDYFLALRNLAYIHLDLEDSSKAVLYAALFEFNASDLLPQSETAQEATALMSLALFYDGQWVRAVERFVQYLPEDWVRFAALGPDEADLFDELDEAIASIEIDDVEGFFSEVETANQKLQMLDAIFDDIETLEASRLASNEELAALRNAGDTETLEERLRGQDGTNFTIGLETVALMDEYLEAAEPDDPINYIFASHILRSYSSVGDLTNSRPYLATLLTLPIEYLATLNVQISEIAALQARAGGLDGRIMDVLLSKAVALETIFPNSDPEILFDLLRASGQAKERQGDFEQAVMFYKKALEHLSNEGLPPVLQLVSELTSALVAQAKFDEARQYANQLLKAALEDANDDGVSAAFGQLALIEASVGNHEAAIDLGQRRLTFENERDVLDPASLWLAKANLLILRLSHEPKNSERVTALAIDVFETIDESHDGIGGEILRAISLKLELSPVAIEGNGFFAKLSLGQKSLLATLMAQTLFETQDLAAAAHWKDLGLKLSDTGSDNFLALKEIDGRLALIGGDAASALLAFREVSDVRLQPAVRSRDGALAHLPYHISAASILAADPVAGQDLRYHAEMFSMAQLYGENTSGSALTASFVRALAGTEVGSLLGEREEIDRKLRELDAALEQARYFGQQSARMTTRAEMLRQKYKELTQNIADLAPEKAAMIASNPVHMRTIADQLRDDEILITYVTSDLVNPYDDQPASYALALTREELLFTPIASRSDLKELSLALRCSAALTDPNCQLGSSSGTRGTFGTFAAVEGRAKGPDFDGNAAYQTYQELLAPIEGLLEGKSRLIVIPDRSLTSMPFHLMLRKPKAAEQSVRDAEWLIRDFSIEITPSVSSFHYLRQRDTSAVNPNSFLGVGDPLIGNQHDGAVPIDCKIASDRPVQLAQGTSLLQRGTATDRLASLIDLAALPDSRCELETVAAGFEDTKLLLHGDATEAGIKALSAAGDLKQYSVISFATHGLVAGEIGVNDAALVLTPPSVATANDDGLLSSAEIANLELDAELVILSACNTASGRSGEEEGLSGLASAFFAAGAKSLIVSHWPVYSDAAVDLSTRTLDVLSTQPGATRANALRAAMLSLLDDPSASSRQLHPSYWGPFMLVGDGLGL